jgi:hypothetical protein
MSTIIHRTMLPESKQFMCVDHIIHDGAVFVGKLYSYEYMHAQEVTRCELHQAKAHKADDPLVRKWRFLLRSNAEKRMKQWN